MPGPLVPEDDLYACLEVEVDASPEAIELAWRALLKRHHPDVAGDGPAALERAKRINVAHDWLADPALRARYDRERLGIRTAGAPPAARERTGVRWGRPARPPLRRRPAAPRPSAHSRPPREHPDLWRGEPAERVARFLDRVGRLTPDELDRLAAADPPPIAFLATIRRFVPPEALASFQAAEAGLAARVPHERWVSVGLREGLLGVAAELVLCGFLDDMLGEPFRSRARERLLRAWEASVEQPRYGPNGTQVVSLRERVGRLTPDEVVTFVRASAGVASGDRPWPRGVDPAEDEALRISSTLAAADVAAALGRDGLSAATAARARRLLGRLGHVVALRHAFSAREYATLVAPFEAAVRDGRPPRGRPGVRRSA